MPLCEHLVQFYDSDGELLDSVVPYLAEGLDAGEAVLVLATEQHHALFEAGLMTRDVDVEQAIADGRYVALDAVQALECIRPHGNLRMDAFDEVIGRLVRQHAAEHRGLRAFGELVGLLWEEGEAAAADELEGMWNELFYEHQFTLLCAYPTSPAAMQRGAVGRVCRSHSSVIPSITRDDSPAGAMPLNAAFTADLDAPRRVRALLGSALADFQFSDDLIERGTLTASELAANAVLHARTPFRLLMQPRAASVWIGVEDHAPLRHRQDVVGRSPHGLGLIATLALRWGIVTRETGKLIWVELPL
jgi:hypothetical protein